MCYSIIPVLAACAVVVTGLTSLAAAAAAAAAVQETVLLVAQNSAYVFSMAGCVKRRYFYNFIFGVKFNFVSAGISQVKHVGTACDVSCCR